MITGNVEFKSWRNSMKWMLQKKSHQNRIEKLSHLYRTATVICELTNIYAYFSTVYETEKKELKQSRVMNWHSVLGSKPAVNSAVSKFPKTWKFSQTKPSDLNVLISEIIYPFLSNPLAPWGCIWMNKINRILGEIETFQLFWVVLSMWVLLTRHPHNYGYRKPGSLTISPRNSYNNEHLKNCSAGLINACLSQTYTAISRNC